MLKPKIDINNYMNLGGIWKMSQVKSFVASLRKAGIDIVLSKYRDDHFYIGSPDLVTRSEKIVYPKMKRGKNDGI